MFKIFKIQLSIDEQIFLSKRLHYLLSSGISVLSSLKIIYPSFTNKKREIFSLIILDVTRGVAFSRAIGGIDGFVSKSFVGMISVGEKSGNLALSLLNLSNELAKDKSFKSKMLGASLYPLCITFFAIIIACLMIFLILPKITQMFTQMNITLPLPTKVLLYIGEIAKDNFMLTSAFLFFIIIFFTFSILKSYKFRIWIEMSLLKLPILGHLIRPAILSKFFRNFTLLINSGFSINEVLEIISNTVSFYCYRAVLKKFSIYVLTGKSLSSALIQEKILFPDFVTHLVEVGESSGSLSSTCAYISQICEEDFDEKVKKISVFIEPALMIFVGCIVGLLTVSIIMPIYEITNTVIK
jgi:type IV pilus assembly protein PilC